MKLVIDNSEPLRIADQFQNLKYNVEILDITKKLEMSGDYYFLCAHGEILIERKTITDFDGSMSNGHIFDQAERMAEWIKNGENRLGYIVTIGDTNFYNEFASINSTSRIGAMGSIMMRYGIPVCNVTTETDFVWLIHKLCRSLNEGKKGEYRTTDLFAYNNPDQKITGDPRTFFIGCFRLIPGISHEKSTAIVDELVIESANDLILLNYLDLIAIDGIGPMTANKILDFWGIVEEVIE